MNYQPILNIYNTNSFLKMFKKEELENTNFLNSLFNVNNLKLISIHYGDYVFDELRDFILFKKDLKRKEFSSNENKELSLLDFSKDKPSFIFSFNNKTYTTDNFNQIEIDYGSFRAVYGKMIGYNNKI